MIHNFKKFIKTNDLFSERDWGLLAISGGKDSTLMAHLFRECNYKFGIAHCNFMLRGEEADKDQLFVQSLARKFNVPFYTINFNTKEIAQKRGISIQMAARDLRYKWLAEIQVQNNYQFLATAHHLNDSIETLIYNLAKGCGIRGLQGIPMQNGTIVRPLLFASAKEIEIEVSKRNMPYRADASNQETKYARNKIRHNILPQLEQLNPSLISTFRDNIQRFKDTLLLFNQAVDQFRGQYVTEKNGLLFIDKTALIQEKAKYTLLYELAKDKGFSNTQIKNILSPATSVGAIFYSDNFRLLVDREHFIISPPAYKMEPISIQYEDLPISIPILEQKLTFAKLMKHPLSIPNDKNIAFIHAQAVQFPLTIRIWKNGDFFLPLGMGGQRKKIQDFFSDLKLSIFEKEQQLLIQNGNGDIIWVVGKRLDERYKIKEETTSFYKISIA